MSLLHPRSYSTLMTLPLLCSAFKEFVDSEVDSVKQNSNLYGVLTNQNSIVQLVGIHSDFFFYCDCFSLCSLAPFCSILAALFQNYPATITFFVIFFLQPAVDLHWEFLFIDYSQYHAFHYLGSIVHFALKKMTMCIS